VRFDFRSASVPLSQFQPTQQRMTNTSDLFPKSVVPEPKGVAQSVAARRIKQNRLKEYLLLDNSIVRMSIGVASLCIGLSLILVGRSASGAEWLGRAHRGAFFRSVDKFVETAISDALAGRKGIVSTAMRAAILSYPDRLPMEGNARAVIDSPERMFEGHALVLKSPSLNEKGVLYLYYSYLYPIFIRTHRASEIAERYRIVLEPSWSGFCDMNILCMAALDAPVFVGVSESRDADFLKRISPRFVPVEFAGNTWIDPEVFKPDPAIPKQFDLICISGWAHYKRHWALFAALGKLRASGLRLRVALVGYPIDLKVEDIAALAQHYGILDQISFFQSIPMRQVVKLLQSSKLNILWSRKEGSNRGIVEGMFVDVPGIMRSGHNYGHHYHQINERTGRFSDEHDLPGVLREMLDGAERFSPRSYVLHKMTAASSTARLNAALRDVALASGEVWTRDIAVKVSSLDSLDYMDSENWERFRQDREYLHSMIRRQDP
jgi:glycosyltransferase involved in cell wall biosynthesis